MGFFGRIVSAIGAGARKFGEFGGAALSKVGDLKGLYDRVNNATDGIIGESLNALPVVGPLLRKAGDFLNDSHKVGSLSNGFKVASGIGDDLSAYGRNH